MEIIGTNATLIHQYIIIAMIGVCLLALLFISFRTMRQLKKKNHEINLLQQQQIAKDDLLRNEYSDAVEKLRIEMLKKEEERTRQWIESEKETLQVLNGVSTILDLGDKISRIESEKILNVLNTIYGKVEKLIEFGGNLEVLTIIKEKVEVLAIIKERVGVLDKIKEKFEVLDVIKERVGVLDKIKEKFEVLDVIKEKVDVLDVIKEKVDVLDVIKEKVERLSLLN